MLPKVPIVLDVLQRNVRKVGLVWLQLTTAYSRYCELKSIWKNDSPTTNNVSNWVFYSGYSHSKINCNSADLEQAIPGIKSLACFSQVDKDIKTPSKPKNVNLSRSLHKQLTLASCSIISSLHFIAYRDFMNSRILALKVLRWVPSVFTVNL